MINIESPLVDTDWLANNILDSNLVVLDASIPPVVPGYVSHNGNGCFSAIPGARRFDYDQVICKPNSPLPHMMPTNDLFEREVRKLGIDNDSVIVVYDDVGLYASPRAWWMLRAMGHTKVSVLNGGLPKWLAEGREVTNDFIDVASGDFNATSAGNLFCDFEHVLGALGDPNCEILDARSNRRFKGLDPEPRPGVRSGHMPSSKNLPFPEVLDGGVLKTPDELRNIFSELVSADQRIITSCGSGITACILTLAANVAGYENLTVYDGSWAEWGLPGKLPVITD